MVFILANFVIELSVRLLQKIVNTTCKTYMTVLKVLPHLLVQWDVKGVVYLMNLQVEINPGKIIIIKQLKISQQVKTLVSYNENDSFHSGMWNNTHMQKYAHK